FHGIFRPAGTGLSAHQPRPWTGRTCQHPVKRIKISLYDVQSWEVSQMPAPAQLRFADLNAALKAAGEETRLRVLALLAEAELTVSDLTEILRQSQPRISRHLRLLAEAGLVERYREGAWAFFRLAEAGPAAHAVRAL